MEMKPHTVKLAPKTKKKLDKIAKERKWGFSLLARTILENFVKRNK